jgi:hypothetical protein
MPVGGVVHLLQLQVRELLDAFRQRRGPVAERLKQPPPQVGITDPDVADAGHRPSVQLRRQERERAGGADPDGQGRLPRRLGEQLAPAPQRRRRVLRA